MSSAEGKSSFVYVTYIRATPEKVWQALTEPGFTRQFWVGTWQECDWKAGAPWRIMIPDGRVADTGEVERSSRTGASCCRGATSSGPSCARKAIRA